MRFIVGITSYSTPIVIVMFLLTLRRNWSKKIVLPAGFVAKPPLIQQQQQQQNLGKTPQQRQYVEYLQQPNISLIVAMGCAGTGKTWLACHAAAQAVQRGEVDRIVLTRPIVPVDGEDGLGFLPGSLESKMDPWTRPMLDVLSPLLLQGNPKSKNNKAATVEVIPLTYMRGRTFDRTFIIADEMQNSTPNQMLMLVTRIGNESRLVITGDPMQTDRTLDNVAGRSNGLSDLEKRLAQTEHDNMGLQNIRRVYLTTEDVQRSALVTELLERVYGEPPATRKPVAEKPPSDLSSPEKPPLNLRKMGTCLDPVNLRKNQDCALIVDDPYLRRQPEKQGKA